MWVRIRVDRSKVKRHTEGTTRKPGRRLSQQPQLEVLEDRQLLTATLQAISNLHSPRAARIHRSRCSPATGGHEPADVHGHLQQPGYRGLDHSGPVLDPRHILHRPRHPHEQLHRQPDVSVVQAASRQHREHDHPVHE